MRVKELIAALQKCDQEKAVFIWNDGDIQAAAGIDELSDRLDINVFHWPYERESKNLIMGGYKNEA